MHEMVKEYYGQRLKSSADLQTSACCDISTTPEWMRSLLARIHPEVTQRYYGCGLVCPLVLEGCHVLDLGCGSGRDVFALSQLVGPQGRVVGVDMTAEQLAVARLHQEFHREQFGHERSNVEFRLGYIEDLGALGLADASFDVVVSNCVVNLSPDKEAVLREVYRLLKPGGEFYFSDIYSDRRVPDHLRDDSVLYGECLGGALYTNDFLGLAVRCGFGDPRLVEQRPVDVSAPELARRVEGIAFVSATYRLFKLALDPDCEDYGQAVIYRGSIEHHRQRFRLDAGHDIEAGRAFPVCGNTWRMLHETRFHGHFQFIGDFSRHFGLFAGCGTLARAAFPDDSSSGSCCV